MVHTRMQRVFIFCQCVVFIIIAINYKIDNIVINPLLIKFLLNFDFDFKDTILSRIQIASSKDFVKIQILSYIYHNK